MDYQLLNRYHFRVADRTMSFVVAKLGGGGVVTVCLFCYYQGGGGEKILE